jgi:polyisoprenoid-binding protein YceI
MCERKLKSLKTEGQGMIYKRLVASIVLALLLTGFANAADQYSLDGAHSSIGFKVTHLVISKVRGSFQKFSGKLMYDEADPTKSSVEVTIDAASIDTDNEKRNNHLRSPDFFDVEKYPEITFKSKSIKKVEDGYVATGDFTMHGVTKEIELPFKITGTITDPRGSHRIGVEAAVSINRQDYGLTWSKTLETGGLVVSDEVDIDIYAEFVSDTTDW